MAQSTVEETPDTRQFLSQGFEFFRHLTTVNTAILVLLVVFVEKLFRTPAWQFLFPISIVFFLISLIASLVGMWYVTTLSSVQSALQWEIDAAAGTGLAAIISFIIAMISFVFFAIRNFIWI